MATSPAVSDGVQVGVGGAVADFGDGDTEGNESVGLMVALIVLLIALGSVAAALLPIGLALFALAIGTGLLGLLAAVGAVPEDTTSLATMIGLGVGIDYALFVLTRYRQLVSEGRIRADAIAHANATAGQAVVLAGTTVLIAIAGLRASGLPAIAMMGYGTTVVVAVSVLAAVTLLPALLATVGHRIDGLFARTRRRRQATVSRPVSATAAGRWAHHIGSHPVRYALASVILLGTLALPLGALRIGFSDAGAESTEQTTRRAYDLLADAFGPGFNGPLLAVADLTASADPEQSATALETALAATDGIQSVRPPLISADRNAAIVTAIPEWSPQDESTATLVDGLHDDVLPAVAADTGATVLLGGSVAGFADVSQQLSARLPWFIGAVVAISVLLLMVVFRSVVVPLKAAVMNLLSIGAAYGVVVAVFQWGWGSSLVGVDEAVTDQPVRAHDDVRHPVRPLDGLRGVPPQSDPRGVRAHWRQPRVCRGRARCDRTGHHQCRPDHDRGLRWVRGEPGHVHEDDRPRLVGSRPSRRNGDPDGPRALDDGADGSSQLVAAVLARPDPPPRRHRVPVRRAGRGARRAPGRLRDEQ